MTAGRPRELAAVDDDAADAGAVAAEPLCQGMDDDVGPVIDGLGEVRGAEGAVDYQGDAVVVGDFGDCIEVGDLERRVRDRLDEEGARVGVDCLAEVFWVGAVDEAHGDAEAGENVVELSEGPAVQVARRNNVVTALS